MKPALPLTIKPSLLKMGGLLLASVTLTALGWWILTLDSQEIANAGRSVDPQLIQVIAAFGVLIFGATTLAVPVALWQSRHGLRIDDQGIHSHTWGGLLAWHEISRVSAWQNAGQQLLLFHLHQPEHLSAKVSRLRRHAMRMNLKNVGTPVVLGNAALKIRFEEMHRLIAERHAAYQKLTTDGLAEAG